MREIKEFPLFGIEYRTKQFSAAHAIKLVEKIGMEDPMSMLSGTEVKLKRSWVPLSDLENVNTYVVDKLDHLAPTDVLKALVALVTDFNFGFLSDWKGAKVPQRFMIESKAIASDAVEPLTSMLIQEKVADLRSLEEYYSLEDAFKMFDVLVVKGINQAYAQEAAEAESKRGR